MRVATVYYDFISLSNETLKQHALDWYKLIMKQTTQKVYFYKYALTEKNNKH